MFRKFFGFLLVFLFSFSVFTSSNAAPVKLNDISGHWAKAKIERAVSLGFINGYPDGTFKPDKSVTRAEFVAILLSSAKITGEIPKNYSFPDVSSKHWASKPIYKAVELGWISGFPDGTFKPEQMVTPEQSSVIACKRLDWDARGVAYQLALKNFPGASSINYWAKPFIGMLQQEGMLVGDATHLLLSGKILSRAEVVVLILNMLDYKAPAMESMTLSTTTSTFDSGLLGELVPVFEKANHVKVKIVSVGTGQSIAIAQKGDADCVLVHARALEDQFMKDGFGSFRLDVMYNDFIIIGPSSDPAGIKSAKTAIEAFQKIASTERLFVSRGDKSGTHVKELDIWKAAGVDPKGTWYISAGQGMGAVLLMADEKQAYTLTDRATYLKYNKDKKIQLVILNEGSKNLLNPYGVIPVSTVKFPGLNSKMADRFAYFITGIPGQIMIREFGKKDFGTSLFFPDSDEYKEYERQ